MKRTRKYLRELKNIRVNMKRIGNKYNDQNTNEVLKSIKKTKAPTFKYFKNDLVFENYLRLPSGSINERILMSFYIGYIPYICFSSRGNYYMSCNSAENRNIQLNYRSFVTKSNKKNQRQNNNKKNDNNDFIIPTEIFWTNIEAPLRVNMYSKVMKGLNKNVKDIMVKLKIYCNTNKKALKVDINSFKPNYQRL